MLNVFSLSQLVMIVGDSTAPMGTVARIAKIHEVDLGGGKVKVYDLYPVVRNNAGEHLLFQGKHLMPLENPRDMIYYYPNIKAGDANGQ